LDGDSSIHITVCYNVNGDTEYEDSWRLYTDSGFSDAISALLGTEVMFTEQGMQEDGYASIGAVTLLRIGLLAHYLHFGQ